MRFTTVELVAGDGHYAVLLYEAVGERLAWLVSSLDENVQGPEEAVAGEQQVLSHLLDEDVEPVGEDSAYLLVALGLVEEPPQNLLAGEE